MYWLRHEGPTIKSDPTTDLFRTPATARATARKLSREGRELKGPSSLEGSTGGGVAPDSFAVDGDSIFYYSTPRFSRGAIFKVGPGQPKFE